MCFSVQLILYSSLKKERHVFLVIVGCLGGVPVYLIHLREIETPHFYNVKYMGYF